MLSSLKDEEVIMVRLTVDDHYRRPLKEDDRNENGVLKSIFQTFA